MKCPICDNDKENKSFIIKEMQQGLREEFEYVECSDCGCLFIKDIPENISKYYDINYAPHDSNISMTSKITGKIFAKSLTNKKLFKLIQGDNPNITHKFWNDLLTNYIPKNSSILDVGCGNGRFLTVLKKAGFKNLTGIDLFIDEKNKLDGIKIFKSSLEEFKPNQKYDLIISNHSFEHMDNQLKNIKCFENLVNDDGFIVIRIPVKSKPVWEKYGVNWLQIDAPRHFFLHTTKSFEILCNKTNLIIENIIFDSEEEIFISCEKYVKNISMRDEEWNTFKLDDKTDNRLRNEIKKLNENNEADQAIFVLRKK